MKTFASFKKYFAYTAFPNYRIVRKVSNHLVGLFKNAPVSVISSECEKSFRARYCGVSNYFPKSYDWCTVRFLPEPALSNAEGVGMTFRGFWDSLNKCKMYISWGCLKSLILSFRRSPAAARTTEKSSDATLVRRQRFLAFARNDRRSITFWTAPRILLRLGLLLSIISLSGCFKKPQSIGDETHLPVIADPENQEVLEPIIREVFEKVIMTPQPEKVFEIQWVPLEEHQEFLNRRNLVLIGLLNSEGEISARVSRMLSPDVRSRVQEGDAFYFTKEDAYAEGQLLMVFASNTLEELQKNLSENKESLRNIFEKKLIEDTAAQMFERLEQKEIGEKFLNEYGWTLRVQHDYIINIERVQNQFVMLRRSLPGRERWLFVHWIENADPYIINKEWAIKTRNKLTEKFYKGDKINEKFITSKEMDFSNRSAIMLEGLWDNEQEMAGGPFRNYAFYDEPSGRIYMIDAAVFYPGGKKEVFLRQLDVMAHTFKTAEEIASESDKETS